MKRPPILLPLAGLVLLAALATLAGAGELHRRIPFLLSVYGVAFAAYLAGLRAAFAPALPGRFLLVVMLGVAVVARLLLLPCRPELSTDIYRYAWEGRVVLQGASPFATAPADSSLKALRDDDYARINHRHMATIYPPLAQGVFALGALLRPGVFTLKALFVLFDIATLLVLLALLRARGEPPARALVYAWNPLVIVETAHSGHMDAIGVFFLVLGVALFERRRVAGCAALGASFLAKYTGAALLPFLVARRQWRGVVVVVLVSAAGYLPFAGAGPRLLDSLRVYGGTWWFNGPPFMALAGWLGDPVMSRHLLAAGGVVFGLAAALRERDIARYTFLVLACWLLIAPTVYPWYLTWMVPFLCLYPSRAWIAFTGLVFLSYWVWKVYGATGAWALPTRILAIEYLPFYGLLVRDAARARSVRA